MEKLKSWEEKFERHVDEVPCWDDVAHDKLHLHRVVAIGKKICIAERANPWIVIPALWLHDTVILRKDDPNRGKASTMSAEKALVYLKSMDYPEVYFPHIFHAIQSHSFSSGVMAETIEAKIVQDADRLDALGAVGLYRMFATAGILKRPFYDENDPFCHQREACDAKFSLDHFYVKLFKVAQTMNTQIALSMATERVNFMKNYLEVLQKELKLV